MRLANNGRDLQLTYCTNIHPANGWREVEANLERYPPALKARFAPERPFGIGLRLAGGESRELLEGDELSRLRAYLDAHGLYVFTINGFPYGPFHKQPVKAEVHAPDWREDERVAYTERLIEILAALLPEGVTGGISTSPLGYKAWVSLDDRDTWELLTRNVVRVAAALARTRAERGKLIHLDIEPEPDGILETSSELVGFFTDWLLPSGAPWLAEMLGVSVEDARAALLEHIRVCFDTCHMAVGYEDAAAVLDRYAAAGIRVGKVQISAALEVPFPSGAAERQSVRQALEPFAESVYLHQVGQRDQDGGYRHYPDLEDALANVEDPRIAEWRIHFHTPIFVEQYGAFRSTQDQIREALGEVTRRGAAEHLEIETYTWDVLPGDLKRDLFDSIAREYDWVLHVLS
jgi:sugar phosphate isomerase/epimerase